jgi:hypothetical protein
MGPASPWELVDVQDGSLSEFYNVLQKMESQNIIERVEGRVSLTREGKKRIEAMNVRFIDFDCKTCDGRGYVIPSELEGVKETFFKISKRRPLPIEEYDQGYMSPSDVLLRIAFMYERGDLCGRDIFVIGDDDLLSIAASLTDLPSKVVAVDIDERLVNFINDVSRAHGLNLSAYLYDVQEPLKGGFAGEFDVFVSDPVETLEGIKLFLSRGVAALRGVGAAGYFGLTTLEASKRKWYDIQGMLGRMGFVITDIRRKFSIYPLEENNFFRYEQNLPIVKKLGVASDYDWFKSAFYRIEAVKQPNPLVRGTIRLGKKIYIDEESWATPSDSDI